MKQTELEYSEMLIDKYASIITELADDIEDIVIQCAIIDVTNTIEALDKALLSLDQTYYQNVLQILKDKL